jgi:hypothetical protein
MTPIGSISSNIVRAVELIVDSSRYGARLHCETSPLQRLLVAEELIARPHASTGARSGTSGARPPSHAQKIERRRRDRKAPRPTSTGPTTLVSRRVVGRRQQPTTGDAGRRRSGYSASLSATRRWLSIGHPAHSGGRVLDSRRRSSQCSSGGRLVRFQPRVAGQNLVTASAREHWVWGRRPTESMSHRLALVGRQSRVTSAHSSGARSRSFESSPVLYSRAWTSRATTTKRYRSTTS